MSHKLVRAPKGNDVSVNDMSGRQISQAADELAMSAGTQAVQAGDEAITEARDKIVNEQ